MICLLYRYDKRHTFRCEPVSHRSEGLTPNGIFGPWAAPGVVLCCLGLFLEHVPWNFRTSWKYWKYNFSLFWFFFSKKTRAEISRRMHRRMSRDLSYETDSGPKTKTVSDLNFQVTAAATVAAAPQHFSHLARALDHHAQGPNIPFGVNPSLRLYLCKKKAIAHPPPNCG